SLGLQNPRQSGKTLRKDNQGAFVCRKLASLDIFDRRRSELCKAIRWSEVGRLQTKKHLTSTTWGASPAPNFCRGDRHSCPICATTRSQNRSESLLDALHGAGPEAD